VSDYYRIRKLIHESEDFIYNAVRSDTISDKEIYVLAIRFRLLYLHLRFLFAGEFV